MPQINAAGLGLIEEFEGLRMASYQDSAGVWTIGYGHTRGVHPGETITAAEAEAFLLQDLTVAEDSVAAAVEVVLTPNQFSALVSFEFNTGALMGSTMCAYINANNFPAAANQFDVWVYAGGQLLQGLVRRRAAEKALFLTP